MLIVGYRFVFWIFLLISQNDFSDGLWWTAGGPLILEPRRICRRVQAGGDQAQKTICRRDRQLLKEIVRGVEIGMDECQHQLRNHRWNCTTRRRSLGKMLLRDTKEAAFVQATTASAVAHVVARACGKGRLSACECYTTRRYRMTNGQWLWEGCGDNFGFGYVKSSEFMDTDGDTARDIRARILRHNNEVGRLAIRNQMSVKCKCHGLSASCELKTCWPRMPNFRQTGDLLLRKFNDAKAVTPNNVGGGSFLWVEDEEEEDEDETNNNNNNNNNRDRRRDANINNGRGEQDGLSGKDVGFLVDSDAQFDRDPNDGVSYVRRRSTVRQEELVYTDQSPNLCKTNRKLGILGTKGRSCNGSTVASTGSCDYLCCGRGYYTQHSVEEVNCRCRFRWCCEVTCDRCLVTKSFQVCR